MAKKLKGVVIRVRDLVAAEARYTALLGVTPWRIPDESFNVPGQIAGIRYELGDTFIQLVAGTTPESPLTATTEKIGEGLSQLSFWVDDIDSGMNLFRNQGLGFTVDEPRQLPFGRVAFTHPKSLNGVMWELEEHRSEFGGQLP